MKKFVIHLKYKNTNNTIETRVTGVLIKAKNKKAAIKKYTDLISPYRDIDTITATLLTSKGIKESKVKDVSKYERTEIPPKPVESIEIARIGLDAYFSNVFGTDADGCQCERSVDEHGNISWVDVPKKYLTPYLSPDRKWCLIYNFDHNDVPEWYPWVPEDWKRKRNGS